LDKIIEICCGSYYDAKEAAIGGAKRIELNSALNLGGLTPGLSTLELIKESLDLKVIAMVRPRGAGFCYIEEDFQVMLKECEALMKSGADGIAFGCLNEDHTIDFDRNKAMMEIIKRYHGEAVFHRAFDCTIDPFETMEKLIEIGVDRVLTSGQRQKAFEGKELIKNLQMKFGDRIEILAGSGVNASNARELMEVTGIHQVHSSCKDWFHDPTTSTDFVSFSYGMTPNENGYEVVSQDLVKKLIEHIN